MTGALPRQASPVVVASGLTKRYGGRTVVDHVSFVLLPGRVYGFLGANGAGKTTILRMLLGLVHPTEGTVSVAGVPYQRLPQPGSVVGALLDPRGAHPSRTGRAELAIVARGLGLGSGVVAGVARRVGIDAHLDLPCRTYSLGMLQRLGLGKALIGQPRVLVLDEPTNGLDPRGVRWLRGVLREVAEAGGTVLVSSHVLGEVQELADELLVLSSGRLVRCGPTEEVLGSGPAEIRVVTRSATQLVDALTQAGLRPRRGEGGTVLVGGATGEQIGHIIVDRRIVVAELALVRPRLEDVFLDLIRDEEVRP